MHKQTNLNLEHFSSLLGVSSNYLEDIKPVCKESHLNITLIIQQIFEKNFPQNLIIRKNEIKEIRHTEI